MRFYRLTLAVFLMCLSFSLCTGSLIHASVKDETGHIWKQLQNPSIEKTSLPSRIGDNWPTKSTITYSDPLYNYQLNIPEGWYISPSPTGVLYGAAVFFNYDPDAVSIRSGSWLEPNMLKIQIGVTPLAGDQGFDNWVTRWLDFETNGHAASGLGLTVTSIDRIKVGQFDAIRYKLNSQRQPSTTGLLIPLGKKVMVVGLSPSDSFSFQSAIEILTTLKIDEMYPFSDHVLKLAEEWTSMSLSENHADSRSSITSMPTYPCPVGATYPGDEAPTSPIPLYMPFRSGETWTVGGYGSFYGNGYHCNSQNDYYATDWNRSGDDDAAVLPVADGIISSTRIPPTCPTGCGCYVQIDHASGIKTLYKHLSGVSRTSGSVSHGDQIGTVGATGGECTPHLHLTFQKSEGSYFSHCYNHGQRCPNGEPPAQPQSPKPSPMNTANGPINLEDGRSYTSNNASSPSRPDLVVESITWNPSNPEVGQQVNFTVRIKNQGAGPASIMLGKPRLERETREGGASQQSLNDFWVDFYINRQPAGCGDWDSATYWGVSSLAAGATRDLIFSYTFNTAGTYNLWGFVDSGCYIPESNDNNNIRQAQITVTRRQLSDLVVESITWTPGHPQVGQLVHFTVRIRNQGAGSTSMMFEKPQAKPRQGSNPEQALGGFWVDFYVNYQPTGCGDWNSVVYWRVDSLVAGATRDLTVSGTFNAAGTYHLWAFVDSGCEVSESNDGNNVRGPVTIVVG